MDLLQYDCINFKKLLILKSKEIELKDHEVYILLIMMTVKEMGIKIITPSVISRYSSLPLKQIDEIMLKLINAHYLDRQNGVLEFNPLYQRLLNIKTEEKQEKNLIAELEDWMGRALSATEIEFINTYKRDGYDDQMIIDAKNEAVKSNVRNFRYVDKILDNWRHYGKKMRKEIKDEKEVDSMIADYKWWDDE